MRERDIEKKQGSLSMGLYGEIRIVSQNQLSRVLGARKCHQV